MAQCEYYPDGDNQCQNEALYMITLSDGDCQTTTSYRICNNCYVDRENDQGIYKIRKLEILALVEGMGPNFLLDGEVAPGPLKHYHGDAIQRLFDIHHACEHYIETAHNVLDTDGLEDDVYVAAESVTASALAVLDLALTRFLEDELVDSNNYFAQTA